MDFLKYFFLGIMVVLGSVILVENIRFQKGCKGYAKKKDSSMFWIFTRLSTCLSEKNIISEVVLDSVHPFAIVGKTEDSMQSYLKDCKDLTTRVVIKKILKI